MKKMAVVILSICLLLLTLPVFSAQNAPSLIDMNRAFLEEKQSAIDWGRDPFILPAPLPEQALLNSVENDAGKAFSLSAIIYRDGEGAAIINHRILRLGDRIEGMMVQEILSDRVILREGSKIMELKVDSFLVK
ncbi:MAG: hypothetical protein MPW14_10515 [Candidatus Manganitrophus sp.]|nr:hypothetical protein [Candidatus Manganitrophus sp.]MDC4223505.1 hypothetical protein [Candidatus Manganitrophus sp.]WDT70628.1 MAG: hypothetical protein MPW17_18035 [Candidatus Manganitrophus sp.]WDT82113.1 MAG: hypothetical protein MPW14_10515 [Candidatus Manganitrophus sp.]